jgi:hypothetical protein
MHRVAGGFKGMGMDESPIRQAQSFLIERRKPNAKGRFHDREVESTKKVFYWSELQVKTLPFGARLSRGGPAVATHFEFG